MAMGRKTAGAVELDSADIALRGCASAGVKEGPRTCGEIGFEAVEACRLPPQFKGRPLTEERRIIRSPNLSIPNSPKARAR